MAFDFPASPALGQIYVPTSGPSYIWDGVKWTATTPPPPVGNFSPCQLRLTLQAATPVMNTPVSGIGFIRLMPYLGRCFPAWDGARMQMYETPEIGQNLSDATKSPAASVANSIYDMFAWNDAGTIRCTRGPPWVSDTSRGTGAGTSELTRVAGTYINANNITNGPTANRGTYVGSIRTNASNQVMFVPGGTGAGGVLATIGIWNMYNRVAVTAQVNDNSAAYSYTTAAWRAANNSNNNRCNFLVGIQEDFWDGFYTSDIGVVPSAANLIGITVDSATATPGAATAHLSMIGGTATHAQLTAQISQQLMGYHYYQAMEYGGAGNTFMQAASPASLIVRGRY